MQDGIKRGYGLLGDLVDNLECMSRASIPSSLTLHVDSRLTKIQDNWFGDRVTWIISQGTHVLRYPIVVDVALINVSISH